MTIIRYEPKLTELGDLCKSDLLDPKSDSANLSLKILTFRLGAQFVLLQCAAQSPRVKRTSRPIFEKFA